MCFVGGRSPHQRLGGAGMAIHNAGASVVARLADLATNDDRSPFLELSFGRVGDRARSPKQPQMHLLAPDRMALPMGLDAYRCIRPPVFDRHLMRAASETHAS